MTDDVDAWLKDGTVQDSKLPEYVPPVPLEWSMAQGLLDRIHQYKRVMDERFEQLSGAELGLFLIGDGDNPGVIHDTLLFKQRVNGGRVLYDDKAMEAAQCMVSGDNESDKSMYRYICGSVHFQPGSTSPSGIDLEEFEMRTVASIGEQTHYGWYDGTADFTSVQDQEGVGGALKDNIAVLVGEDGERKMHFKVNYGYGCFLILCGNQDPWIGVGEAREYAYDRNPIAYKLFRPEDGTNLNLTDDDVKILSDDTIANGIETFVSPYRIVAPSRPAAQRVITTVRGFAPQRLEITPEQLITLEDALPMEAHEFLTILKRLADVDDDNPDVAAIQHVVTLFNGMLKKGTYDEQHGRVEDVLRRVSPQYDAYAKQRDEAAQADMEVGD